MHPAHAYARNVDLSTLTTFRALVSALIPNTPELSVFGAEQTLGATDFCIQDYLIWELDHSLLLVASEGLANIPLSASTAILLNAGAIELLNAGQAQCWPNLTIWHLSPFASIAAIDRIRVLQFLGDAQLEMGPLPPPYGNKIWIVAMISFLNRHSMFGNYSEWPAYGSTRLMTPVDRRLQYFPVSWSQVGYPGVQPGYRVFMGSPLTIVREGGTSTVVSS
ncbi:hypothetical protein ACX93W_04330 [Paenibacillus sp. CAU 1782]